MELKDATESFCPEVLGRDREILAGYWRSRGEGEMGAELAFAQICEDLTKLGAPRPLIELAERATRDERKHGLWGRDFALRFGSRDGTLPQASRTRCLQLPGASERDNRVLRIVFCCLTETVGCHVLRAIRPVIVEPLLRENNQAHLADELQHARVGWGFLSLLGERDRGLVRSYLPLLLRLARRVCCEGPETDEFERLVPYGYFAPKVLSAAFDEALGDVIVPGLAHFSIQEAA